MMISHHVSYLQIFGNDQATGVDDLSGDLVMEVRALVSDFPMEAGQDQPGFLSVCSAFFLPGQFTLFALEFRLRLSEVLRVFNLSPIGEDSETLEADVNADCAGGNRSGLRFVLDGETGVPMVAIPPDRTGLDLAGDLPVHPDFEVSDLGEFQFAILDPEARLLGVGDAVVSTLAFEARIAGLAVFLLKAPEEPLEGPFDPKKNVLQHLRMDFFE